MTQSQTISDKFIAEVTTRLSNNKRVRRNLPVWGRLHIDRQLPFLCVYRRPSRRQDEGTEQLVMSQPAYIVASGRKSLSPSLARLVESLAQLMLDSFGSFLLVELWSGLEQSVESPLEMVRPEPAYQILLRDDDKIVPTVETLENHLARITIQGLPAEVTIASGKRPAPPRLPTLLNESWAQETGCATIGLVVRPVFRDPVTGDSLPLIHQAMIRDLNRALQRTFYSFVRTRTTLRPPHYQMLGRRAVVKAVWQVDQQLAEISDHFDFLLLATPTNMRKAWIEFKRQRFQRVPTFYYRPRPVDPALLKRRLWNVHIERVEDPTLQHLFREKRKELDLKMSLLSNINKPSFLFGSLQLYGEVDDQLVATATEILRVLSPHRRRDNQGQILNSRQFAARAREELGRYRQDYPGISARVYERDDITGLMVSKGNLLVGKDIKVAENRVNALINHEVGVHIVTYFNGQDQPLKLLHSGLAGYDECQEGLAVLAEYLVGELNDRRLRQLAARVLAARYLVDGATFIDTFSLLNHTHRFSQQTAFNITARVYRAGGLTKDAVYLRGLIVLLEYLKTHTLHDLLFIGKIAMDDLPIIQELTRRKVLHAPCLIPRFMDIPESADRLVWLRNGLSIHDLVQRSK